MEENGRVDASTRAAENVNAGNGPALGARARSDNLSIVRELSNEVVQECEMVSIWVIRREPGVVNGLASSKCCVCSQDIGQPWPISNRQEPDRCRHASSGILSGRIFFT